MSDVSWHLSIIERRRRLNIYRQLLFTITRGRKVGWGAHWCGHTGQTTCRVVTLTNHLWMLEQDIVGDGKHRPWCCHLANWTKHASLLYTKTWCGPQNWKYITLHCRQKRTEPRSQATWTGNMTDMQTNKQTNKQTNIHTYTLIAIPFTVTGGGEIPLRLCSVTCIPRTNRRARPACIAMPPVGLCFTDDFLFQLSPLSFDKGCTDLNADCCVNTVDEKFLCLKIWWTSVKESFHSNQFCGARRRQVGISRLYCLCWHCTTDGNIATPIVALSSKMISLRLTKISVNFGPVTFEIF